MTQEEKKRADAKVEADEKAKADADAKAEADKKDNGEIEPVDFVRRDTRPGIYTSSSFGKTVTIKDRAHYYAKTQEEIDFFKKDPEIVVFNPGKKKKKEEDKK